MSSDSSLAEAPHGPAPPEAPEAETSAGPNHPVQRAGRLSAWMRETAAALFGLDLRSLALFRIGLGLILVTDLIRRWLLIEPFYSDLGVIPRSIDLDVLHTQNFWSLHLATGMIWGESIFFAAALLFALALLAGWRTRLATVASWVLLISLHNRNTFVTNAGDSLLRQLLFWSLFLPLGARFSLDRALLRGKLPAADAEARSVISVGSAALTVQVVLVYFGSAYFKTGAAWHQDGTALYYALSFGFNATSAAGYLLHYPKLLEWMTHGTLLLEYFGPLLLFVPAARGPCRVAAVAIFTLFHLAIAVTFNIRLFAAICICAWLALLPAWFWEKLSPGKAARRESGFAFPPRWRGEGLHLRTGIPGTLAAVFFLLLVSGWVIRGMGVPVLRDYCPTSLDWLCTTLRIDQHWGMFAPSVPEDHGWYVGVGTLRSGKVLDVLRAGAPVTWERPKVLSSTYDGPEWANYLLYLASAKFASYRGYYAAYLCRKWNEKHAGADQLKVLELYYMHVRTLPPATGGFSPAERIPLLTYNVPP